MRQFFKYVLATLTGLVVFGVLSFLVLVGFVAALASSDKEVSVASDSVLELKLDKPINERESRESFGAAFSNQADDIGLDQLKATIRRAKADSDIKGIFLNVELVQAGMASLEEVRDALLDFKKSGKFVVAYADAASEKSYYLTSVASR
ncbi:MAG: signal peptide peptidase SppA, partial [Hymenobacter sp.]|nr:signal peptide peptidase SppA [Hymenobacter sp.]